jgi:hypothetical protein
MTARRSYLIWSIWIVGMFLSMPNLILCVSPHTALHGGIGTMGRFEGAEWPIHLRWVILGCLIPCAIFAATRRFRPSPGIVIISAAYFLSGAVNGVLFVKPYVYGYEILTWLAIYLVASADANSGRRTNELWFPRIGVLVVLLIWISLALTIALPFKFGFLTLQFSRADRGEITLWYLFGLDVLIGVLTATLIAVRVEIRMWIRVVLWISLGAVIFLNLAQMNRYHCAIAAMPLLVGLLYRYRSARTMFAWAGILMAVVLAIVLSQIKLHDIIVYLMPNVQSNYGWASDIDYFMSGRNFLWNYHWRSFCDAPAFGNGVMLVARNSTWDTTIKGSSEIGVLRFFSEAGLVFGAALAVIVIAVIVRWVRMMRETHGLITIFIWIMFASLFPGFIFQEYTKIYMLPDILFWYALFYIWETPLQSERSRATTHHSRGDEINVEDVGMLKRGRQ